MAIIDSVYPKIMQMENATEDMIEEDAFEAFKLECDYIDIILGGHSLGERIDVEVEIEEDHDIKFKINTTGKLNTKSEAYIMLNVFADDFSIVQGKDNQYLTKFTLPSFINF